MTNEPDSVQSSSEREDENRAISGWQRVEATCERAFIVFALYAFSIGPMYWAWYAGKYVTGSTMIALLYEPLWRLAGLIPMFGEWLNGYVRWWIL